MQRLAALSPESAPAVAILNMGMSAHFAARLVAAVPSMHDIAWATPVETEGCLEFTASFYQALPDILSAELVEFGKTSVSTAMVYSAYHSAMNRMRTRGFVALDPTPYVRKRPRSAPAASSSSSSSSAAVSIGPPGRTTTPPPPPSSLLHPHPGGGLPPAVGGAAAAPPSFSFDVGSGMPRRGSWRAGAPPLGEGGGGGANGSNLELSRGSDGSQATSFLAFTSTAVEQQVTTVRDASGRTLRPYGVPVFVTSLDCAHGRLPAFSSARLLKRNIITAEDAAAAAARVAEKHARIAAAERAARTSDFGDYIGTAEEGEAAAAAAAAHSATAHREDDGDMGIISDSMRLIRMVVPSSVAASAAAAAAAAAVAAATAEAAAVADGGITPGGRVRGGTSGSGSGSLGGVVGNGGGSSVAVIADDGPRPISIFPLNHAGAATASVGGTTAGHTRGSVAGGGSIGAFPLALPLPSPVRFADLDDTPTPTARSLLHHAEGPLQQRDGGGRPSTSDSNGGGGGGSGSAEYSVGGPSAPTSATSTTSAPGASDDGGVTMYGHGDAGAGRRSGATSRTTSFCDSMLGEGSALDTGRSGEVGPCARSSVPTASASLTTGGVAPRASRGPAVSVSVRLPPAVPRPTGMSRRRAAAARAGSSPTSGLVPSFLAGLNERLGDYTAAVDISLDRSLYDSEAGAQRETTRLLKFVETGQWRASGANSRPQGMRSGRQHASQHHYQSQPQQQSQQPTAPR